MGLGVCVRTRMSKLMSLTRDMQPAWDEIPGQEGLGVSVRTKTTWTFHVGHNRPDFCAAWIFPGTSTLCESGHNWTFLLSHIDVYAKKWQLCH
jgi:hypothetical protein